MGPLRGHLRQQRGRHRIQGQDRPTRTLPHTAAEDLLEIIMRRYERFSAMLDRLLHHGHVLKCGPRSWRTKAASVSAQ
jgi:hypothetical protein